MAFIYCHGTHREGDEIGSGECRMKPRPFFLAVPFMFLAGCLGMPEGVEPVRGFEIDRYLGKWYEIARLDHRFERGLDRVTAEYSLNDDGTIRVVNRGYARKTGRWEEATGKASFVREDDVGYLKVSFFGPFYGSYVVFELDKVDYYYAFVAGPSISYLWLLARSPNVDEAVVDRFVEKAKALGVNPEDLIFVDHGEDDAESADSRPRG